MSQIYSMHAICPAQHIVLDLVTEIVFDENEDCKL
jgi:hypothetical protein